MKYRTFLVVIAVLCLVASVGQVGADEEKSWKELDQEAKRAKIDETANGSLQQVLEESPKAKELHGNSYGWAAFDNLKIAIGISGGGGNGVAVNLKSGERTYMKMGTAGIGIGIGGKKYQVVFLFQDETTFRNFVDKGWKAGAEAGAGAGKAGVAAETGFVNGIAVYQLTDKGLIAAADVSGTKYWKNDNLN